MLNRDCYMRCFIEPRILVQWSKLDECSSNSLKPDIRLLLSELYSFFDNEKIQIVAPAVLPITPVPSSNLIQVYLEPLRRLSTAPPQPPSHITSTQSGPP